MRICIVKSTKQIIEMQSHAIKGTLFQNAINAGYFSTDIEEKEVSDAEYVAAKAVDPNWIVEQQTIADRAATQKAKVQAMVDNFPSWSQVSTAVDNISNLAEAKTFIKKLARIVYWLACDKAD